MALFAPLLGIYYCTDYLACQYHLTESASMTLQKIKGIRIIDFIFSNTSFVFPGSTEFVLGNDLIQKYTDRSPPLSSRLGYPFIRQNRIYNIIHPVIIKPKGLAKMCFLSQPHPFQHPNGTDIARIYTSNDSMLG